MINDNIYNPYEEVITMCSKIDGSFNKMIKAADNISIPVG